jgi:hypothetical protein
MLPSGHDVATRLVVNVGSVPRAGRPEFTGTMAGRAGAKIEQNPTHAGKVRKEDSLFQSL